MPKILIEAARSKTYTVEEVPVGQVFEDDKGNLFLRFNDRFTLLRSSFRPGIENYDFRHRIWSVWDRDCRIWKETKVVKLHGVLEIVIQ